MKKKKAKEFMKNGGVLVSSRGDEAYYNGKSYKIRFNVGSEESKFDWKYLDTFSKKRESQYSYFGY